MTPQERQSEEHDIARIITRFFLALDEREYERLAELMAADGVWHRQGKPLKGPQEVLAALKLRPAGQTTRHCITNALVDIIDGSSARAVYYSTVFARIADEALTGPLPMEHPYSVVVYDEQFSRTADGWRIQRLAGRVIFTRNPAN